MPPILIAFFILLGGMTAPPLVKGVVAGKDPSSRSKFGEPARQEYRTWASRMSPAQADADGTCQTTFFAMSTRNAVVRARLDGVEQGLDWSFSKAVLIPAGTRQHFKAEYLSPVGGEVLACHEVDVACYGKAWSELRDARNAAPCAEVQTPNQKSRTGDPRLVLRGGMTLAHPATNGADMVVSAEIEGLLTEKWYCPAVRFEWPDGSESKMEADCAPWPPEDLSKAERKWKRSHWFPAGEWTVRVVLSRSGKDFARQEVRVIIKGDESAGDMRGLVPQN